MSNKHPSPSASIGNNQCETKRGSGDVPIDMAVTRTPRSLIDSTRKRETGVSEPKVLARDRRPWLHHTPVR